MSKKEQPKTVEHKTAKIQSDQMYMAFGLLTSNFSVERDFNVELSLHEDGYLLVSSF